MKLHRFMFIPHFTRLLNQYHYILVSDNSNYYVKSEDDKKVVALINKYQPKDFKISSHADLPKKINKSIHIFANTYLPFRLDHNWRKINNQNYTSFKNISLN